MSDQRQMLPHDLDAESSLLGSCLASPTALTRVVGDVSPEDFYRDAHRHIWRAMLDLYATSVDVDAITVSAELSRQGILEEVGGRAFVHTLLSMPFAAVSVARYAEIVCRNATWRHLAQVGNQIAEMSYEASGDPDDLLERAEKLLYGVRRTDAQDGWTDAEALMLRADARLDRAKAGIKTCGHSTGFVTIDDIIGGMESGALILLAARPSVGKTALACNIAARVAAERNVSFFSLEMSSDDIFDRIYLSDARVSPTLVRAAAVSDAQYLRAHDAMERAGKLLLHVDDSAGTTMLSMRSKVRRWATRCEPGMVVVDYLQLMTSGDRSTESRNYELASISRQMKQLAREFKVPVLCLSQLSRPPKELRHDPKPRLSDLRDSGALEQDADIVMSLWRKEPTDDKPDDGRVQLCVLKNRNGKIGDCPLVFDKEHVLFRDDI